MRVCTPNSTGALRQLLEQFAPGQEDFVDEVDVARPRRDQPVEFVEDRRKRTAAVAVAEILLGAEGAVIGAAARDLHLGARAGRRPVEAVMMMRVPPQRLFRPAQRRQPGHVGGLRSALDDDVAVRRGGTGRRCSRQRRARRLGEATQYLLAFADDRRHRRRACAASRAASMEPCGPTATVVSAMPASAAQRQLRHPQFRRRAAPEQVARRRRHDEHVGSEAGRPERPGPAGRAPRRARRKSRASCPAAAEQRLGIAVFERQMRLAAAEIDAALERPGRVDQRDPHCAACNGCRRRAGLTSSHS